MRWTYTSPEKKEFIFDGRTSWLFTPSEEQVVTATLDEAERRSLPFLFLNDPAATRASFRVTEKKNGGSTNIVLESKNANDAIRRITVTRSNQDRYIRTLEYLDRGGNRTRFEFSGHRKRVTPQTLFSFTPPAGVEVVRN